MTTPAILAGTISITLSAAVRHSGGGKEALEVSASSNCSIFSGWHDQPQARFSRIFMHSFAPPTVHRSVVL